LLAVADGSFLLLVDRMQMQIQVPKVVGGGHASKNPVAMTD